MSLYESLPISSVWAKLESTYGEIFSLYLKDLLIECAYDSFQSLFNIVAGSIRPMEQDLNNSPRATQRYCDKFKVKHDSFKFKPAHRDIILSIPGICEDMKEEMDKMSNPAKSSSVPTKNKTTAREKPKPERSTGKSTTTIKSLKEVLVSKVKRCAREMGLKLEDDRISEHNIIEFKRSSDGYSCQFTCPLCEKPYVVNYKKSWDTNNIKRHFGKTHRPKGSTAGTKGAERPDEDEIALAYRQYPTYIHRF